MARTDDSTHPDPQPEPIQSAGTQPVAGRQERFKAAVAVYGLLRREDRLLLLRRAGSGFHDGELALPAGHVDRGESAIDAIVRELSEELGIRAEPEACRLGLTGHAGPERPGDDTYVDFYFLIERWTGEPVIGEPDRATELLWAPLDDLPSDTVGFMAEAIRAITDGTDPRLKLWHWPARDHSVADTVASSVPEKSSNQRFAPGREERPPGG